MYLRSLERADLDEVLRIERSRFESPWSDRDFYAAMKTGHGTVCVHEGRIYGYVVWIKERYLRILNIAVLTKRIGCGRYMLDNLVKMKRQVRVNESNLEAQLFFKAMGFTCAKIEKEFYADGSAAYLFVSGK